MNKKVFYYTLMLSIIVQIITGLMDVGALFVKIPTRALLIKQLLLLELIVQVIEGGFYFWLAYNFTKISNVTPKRYLDWVITTPTMLITLIMYLIYLNKKENKELELFTLLKDNSNVIVPVLVLNWVMLLFGYLGEIKALSFLTSTALGFIPFLIYYYIIYVNYVTTNNGYYFFWYFFIFWALYGVAAILPYFIKNMFYNILDLFAKNFFGLFLAYIIFTGSF
jgi:hypothetical protein